MKEIPLKKSSNSPHGLTSSGLLSGRGAVREDPQLGLQVHVVVCGLPCGQSCNNIFVNIVNTVNTVNIVNIVKTVNTVSIVNIANTVNIVNKLTQST